MYDLLLATATNELPGGYFLKDEYNKLEKWISNGYVLKEDEIKIENILKNRKNISHINVYIYTCMLHFIDVINNKEDIKLLSLLFDKDEEKIKNHIERMKNLDINIAADHTKAIMLFEKYLDNIDENCVWKSFIIEKYEISKLSSYNNNKFIVVIEWLLNEASFFDMNEDEKFKYLLTLCNENIKIDQKELYNYHLNIMPNKNEWLPSMIFELIYLLKYHI